MIYNEFITSNVYKPLFTDVFTQRFPYTMEYLNKKYFNYELKYPPEVFFRLAFAKFLEYQTLLKDVENAIQIRNTKTFGEDNLGKVKKLSKKDVKTEQSKNKEMYKGFNVADENGNEYQIDGRSVNVDNTGNASTTDVNLLSALRELESDGKQLSWFKFEREFTKLFITIYTIDI